MRTRLPTAASASAKTITATPGQRSVTGPEGGGTNFISRRNM